MKKTPLLLLSGSTLLLLALTVTARPVWAANDSLKALKAQIASLQKQVNQLKAEKASNPQQAPQPQPAPTYQNQYYPPTGGGWDPFTEMQRMQEEMARMLQQSFAPAAFGNAPRTGMFQNNLSYNQNFDLKKTKNGYQIAFNMKGLDKDKLDIEVNDHSITISGQRSASQKQSNKNSAYSAQSFSSFLQTVPLPKDADPQKMETKKQGDQLIITIPKKA